MGEAPELKEWRERVGGAGFGEKRVQAREQFYAGLAALKTEVPDVDSVVDDPKSFGLKAFEDVEKYEGLIRDISKGKYKPHSGETLYETLADYFRKNLAGEIKDKKALRKRVDKEVALTMHYLGTKQRDKKGRKINVDLVRRGETVEIRDGRLYIYRKDAEGNIVHTRVEGAYLRQPPTGEAPVAPPPAHTPAPTPTTRRRLTVPLPPEEGEEHPTPAGGQGAQLKMRGLAPQLVPPQQSAPKEESPEEKLLKEIASLRDRMTGLGMEMTRLEQAVGYLIDKEIIPSIKRLQGENIPPREIKLVMDYLRKEVQKTRDKIREFQQDLIAANQALMSLQGRTRGSRLREDTTLTDQKSVDLTQRLTVLKDRLSNAENLLNAMSR